MTEPRRLPDRWNSRDFPVLVEAARTLDLGATVQASELAEAEGVNLTADEVMQAMDALVPGYMEGEPVDSLAGRVDFFVVRLTERGRRAVGLWPDEDQAADALVDLLNQAADQTSDEDDAGALRKAGRLLRSVPSAVIADVTAAFIRQQTGI